MSDRFVYIIRRLDRSLYLFNPEFVARVSIEALFRIFLHRMYVKCCAVHYVKFSSQHTYNNILKILHNGRSPWKISQIVVGIVINKFIFRIDSFLFSFNFSFHLKYMFVVINYACCTIHINDV